MDPYRALGWFTLAFSRRSVTVCESRRIDPRLERGLVAPACDDQPGCSIVGGLEQFEALEPVLVVHSACSCRKPAGQFVSAVGRHRDGVDLDDSHIAMMAETTCVAFVALGVPSVSERRPTRMLLLRYWIVEAAGVATQKGCPSGSMSTRNRLLPG